MINLVTGFRNSPHITADDQGALNAQIFGNGNYVFQNGKKLAATLVSNNLVRVLDGDFMIQGRFARIAAGTFEDMAIANGEQGKNRNDLVVMRYNRNTGTGVEEISCIVLKGTSTTGSASDPAYNNNDIINSNAATTDFPLYRVKLNGLNVESVDPLLTVVPFVYADTITTERIADGAVTGAKIASGTLTASKYADRSVQTAKIVDNAVTESKIASDAVTSAKIADGAVTTDKMQNAAVNAYKIAPNAVLTSKIANSAVTGEKIANGAVTDEKLATAYLPKAGGTLAGNLILTENVHYGTSLPSTATKGRIFFKKV